jgi:hypothetical protein
MPYARSLSPYRVQPVRASGDAPGYYLLIDPQRAAKARYPRQATAGAQ